MPSFVSHYLLGKRVYLNLIKNDDILSLLAENNISKDKIISHDSNEAMLWGSQGPDVFFIQRLKKNIYVKTLGVYGSRLHNTSPAVLLDNMHDIYEKSKCKLPLLPYIFGFICHYSFDSVAHPFVQYNMAELREKKFPNVRSSALHGIVETYLDAILLKKECNIFPAQIDIKNILPKNNLVDYTVAYIYSRLLERLFPRFKNSYYDKKSLLRVCNDFRRVLILSQDKKGRKKRFFEAMENKFKIQPYISSHVMSSVDDEYDYANFLHNVWLCRNTETDESFIDIFKKAEKNSLNIIKGFLAEDDMKKITGNVPFY